MVDQRLAEIWPSVIKAIEDSLPYYDRVNQAITLGLAAQMRAEAAKSLKDKVKEGVILDLGIGPGNMSLALLKILGRSNSIVGADYSVLQLGIAKKRLEEAGLNEVYPVRAVFEALPFKEGVFQCVCSAYAVRDAVDKTTTIREAHRVICRGARFAIVDMGKPDNYFARAIMAIYITVLMPLLAKLIIRRKIRGNPWRKLAATYRTLPCNREMLTIVANIFGTNATRISTRLFGGLTTISADKT